eukprot:TRINITY_DN26853_c0_g1_i1.p1 TRINITY_DN26853_c0_g1~~TRINITY_DN26853_c0_g1_i1.p1  ORF type:complete len:405 (+),score=50.59 TRINITY_DN26853_c0_g1_i1:81-1295(+)
MKPRYASKYFTLVAPIFSCTVLLLGCHDDNDTPNSLGKRTTVFVMRHCARAMPESGIDDVENLRYFDNYSSEAWASFGSDGEWDCLARGERIVEQTGEWLKKYGSLPAPIRAIADDVQRDHMTAQKLLQGLGVSTRHYSSSTGPYSVAETCPNMSADDYKAALEQQLADHPITADWYAPMQNEVRSVVGTGAAGDWNDTSCRFDPGAQFKDWWAPYKGACQAASQFASRFLMQWGGGIDIGWNKVLPTSIPRLLSLHSWYFTLTLNAPAVVARREASIVNAVARILEHGEQGTTFLVGHDTNQGGLNGALGLSWQPDAFPANSTMPGSMLRFDLQDNTVTASYAFVEDFSKGGSLKSVPVEFPGTASSTMALDAFLKLADGSIVAECANHFPPASVAEEAELAV